MEREPRKKPDKPTRRLHRAIERSAEHAVGANAEHAETPVIPTGAAVRPRSRGIAVVPTEEPLYREERDSSTPPPDGGSAWNDRQSSAFSAFASSAFSAFRSMARRSVQAEQYPASGVPVPIVVPTPSNRLGRGASEGDWPFVRRQPAADRASAYNRRMSLTCPA